LPSPWKLPTPAKRQSGPQPPTVTCCVTVAPFKDQLCNCPVGLCSSSASRPVPKKLPTETMFHPVGIVVVDSGAETSWSPLICHPPNCPVLAFAHSGSVLPSPKKLPSVATCQGKAAAPGGMAPPTSVVPLTCQMPSSIRPFSFPCQNSSVCPLAAFPAPIGVH